MEAYYQGTYRDQYGEEAIIIRNDGKDLWTTIRGVELVTRWFFDDVEMDEEKHPNPPPLAIFGTENVYWWTLTCSIPIPVVTDSGEICAPLIAKIEKTKTANEPYGQLYLTLILEINGQKYEHKDKFFFDDVLLKMQNKMPVGWYVKSCVNCYLSEPQPSGGPAFLNLGCFRRNRERLKWARSFNYSKPYIFQIWNEKPEEYKKSIFAMNLSRLC